jgi:two-component system NtrC family response regulator
MDGLREQIARVAPTDFTVLIEGETGVGKELVARAIHALSGRRYGPFIALNCAALVETLLETELFGIEHGVATGVRARRGKFECADRGTLFLDEVSDLSASAQAKLLRALEDLTIQRVGGQEARRVDIRVIAATNRNLEGLITDGLFRADLFHRLNGVEIHVPPLRRRKEDILQLAAHFLERYRPSRVLELSSAAAEALQVYAWPGNVRELQRVLERLIALAPSDRIELQDLPPRIREDFDAIVLPSLARDDTLRTWAGRYARLVLERYHGNKRQACRVLGISYHTLQSYVRFVPDSSIASLTDSAGELSRNIVSTSASRDVSYAFSHPGRRTRHVEAAAER